MNEFLKKIQGQIEKNNQLIAEARATIEKMRELFRSLGADLDSGENVFLTAKDISPEGKTQALETIQKFEREYEDRYQDYLNATDDLPGEKRPATLKKAVEESQRVYLEAKDRNRPPKRGIKRLRL